MCPSSEKFLEGNSLDERQNPSNSLLEQIDFSKESNRHWICNCYRKLNNFIMDDSTKKYNFSKDFTKLINLITKHSYSIRPLQFNERIQIFSKELEESTAAKKKCEVPLICKSEKNQWVPQKIQDGTVQIEENNSFTLKIQGQQKSTIVLTYENNHPLRVIPEKTTFYYEKAIIQISPPTTIFLVVIKQHQYTFQLADQIQRTQILPFKLPSNSVKIQVTAIGNKKGYNQFPGLLHNDIMIRPAYTFDNAYSNSQGGMSEYIPIENQSKSKD